jgi:hypothetical protein
LPPGERRLDLRTDGQIVRFARHAGQVARDPHLLDEGTASTAHGKVQPHVEALPTPKLAVDETAGAFGDFTASEHQINPCSGLNGKDSGTINPLQLDDVIFAEASGFFGQLLMAGVYRLNHA